jgi:hypothetical protein
MTTELKNKREKSGLSAVNKKQANLLNLILNSIIAQKVAFIGVFPTFLLTAPY